MSPGAYTIRFSGRDGRVALTETQLYVIRVLTEPSGSISTPYPLYRWSAVTGVDSYTLRVVRESDGAVLHQQTYAAAAVCSGATCSVNPQVFLPAGGYRWWIQMKLATRPGPWSESLAFDTKLPAPTLIAPGDGYQSSTPTYQWTPVDGAQSYTLRVGGSTNVDETYGPEVCTSGICTVTPGTSLESGGYNWWVYATNEAGAGNSSVTRQFAVPAGPACNDNMCFDNLNACEAGCAGGTCERRITCGGPAPEAAHKCFCN